MYDLSKITQYPAHILLVILTTLMICILKLALCIKVVTFVTFHLSGLSQVQDTISIKGNPQGEKNYSLCPRKMWLRNPTQIVVEGKRYYCCGTCSKMGGYNYPGRTKKGSSNNFRGRGEDKSRKQRD